MKIRNSKTGELYEIRNLEYLPLFFRIPYEILNSVPELVSMPRNIYKILLDDFWREKLMSDLFLVTVKDCIAFYVWKAFEINPYIHCFSGYDPLFQLAYCTDYWRDALDDYGFSAKDLLFKQGKSRDLPWLSIEEAEDTFVTIGKHGINKHHLQPIIDYVKQKRCHEDYDARMSNPKIDFYRKWNHSRAKAKVVSLDAMIENENNQLVGGSEEYYDILDQVIDYNKISFEHNSVYKMDLERYMDSLSETDKEVFQLKYNGYTQKEIAKNLGYKTHSAVGKRINGNIINGYINYFSWDLI